MIGSGDYINQKFNPISNDLRRSIPPFFNFLKGLIWLGRKIFLKLLQAFGLHSHLGNYLSFLWVDLYQISKKSEKLNFDCLIFSIVPQRTFWSKVAIRKLWGLNSAGVNVPLYLGEFCSSILLWWYYLWAITRINGNCP